MKLGLTYFPTDQSIHPSDFAVAAEERGFDSIWLAEHSQIPVSLATPGPNERVSTGRPVSTIRPQTLVALSIAAARTTLNLETRISLAGQRNVFQTRTRS